ncbi:MULTISPECIES: AAA family ATPase [Iodidimonas]|jgi:adenylate kinase|uniref:Adenylate kinase n=1 Tax=Iodidimonas nitroreducens TaxID=1236968 RepID=A0A5A7N2T5_9PROT|nr:MULTISPECIES: AAA family ATPase [Iodidimonas]GAK34704.1 adenylate kinase [alpha proteobacterium Q-1]GER02601.1 hypothetical protein JCM17846_02830 [Iodidimonas nitroreducens]
MNQRIVAFTGISGVGKTTFLCRLAKLVDFQHLTGGSLIAAARQVPSEGRDAIRYSDLDDNQRLLIEGFILTRDPNSNLVVIDGHVVIDDGKGLTKISSEIFRALGVSFMVHLESEPERIAANRGADTSRSRPTYPSNVLKQHQVISRAHAQAIADIIDVPFFIVTHKDIDQLASLLIAE